MRVTNCFYDYDYDVRAQVCKPGYCLYCLIVNMDCSWSNSSSSILDLRFMPTINRRSDVRVKCVRKTHFSDACIGRTDAFHPSPCTQPAICIASVFRKLHSCKTQLLVTVQDLLFKRDKHIPIDMAILDFSKAFDTVPHRRLLGKLSTYGINGPILRWIEAFFVDHVQGVVVEGSQKDKVL